MAVKIKTKLTLNKLLPDARSEASKTLKNSIVASILEKITQGLSPVKGFNRYKPYRPSTAKKKGRKQPVDLIDTGKFLRALKAVQRRGNILIEVFFQGKRNNDIATYHNFGTPNMDARPVLPAVKGQTFKKSIEDDINKAVDKAFNDAVKKQNR